jgi:beta-lactamase regulating signal transducer with metallopeptidase domain
MIATELLPLFARSPAPVPSAPDLLGILVKVTLVLATSALLAALLRRQAAATRHLVWLLGLAGALAVAALTPFAPRLEIALPRLVVPLRPAERGSVPATGAPAAPSRNWAVLGEVPMRAAVQAVGLPATRPRGATSSPESGRLALAALLAVWAAGALLVLLWSALGHLALALIARDADPLDAREWGPLLAASPADAAAARRVRVATSAHVGAPLMWGWPHPVILLPHEARAWPATRLRDALLHELAHVTRGDYPAQSLATFACAVFWFHPLAWHAAARLRSECEHACDDRVLAAGTAAPEYATTLLEVARAARSLRVAGGVAVGMARRSHLEGRLLAVLDDARPRTSLPRPARAAACLLTALVLVPLAGLAPRSTAATTATGQQPSSITIATSGSSKTTSVTTSTTTGDSGDPGTAAADPAPGAKFERQFPAKAGGVLDLDLETGATVRVKAWDQPNVSVLAKLSGRDWRGTRFEAVPSAGGVRVRMWQTPPGDRSYSTSHVMEIQVPARYDLRLQSGGGGVSIVGVNGTFAGVTGGGDIELDHDRGRADLSTGGGAIDVTDCDLDGSVATGGGAVRIERSRGGLVGSSGSGDVRTADGEDHADVQVGGEHTGGDGFVRVAKAGGDVDIAEAPHGAHITTGGGDVHVGRATGTVAITTGGGDIDVGPVAGSVWAGTGSGSMTVRLSDPHGEKQTVDLASGTGKVILELPANLDARFDLETAYTDNFGRATNINSAWNLQQTRTQAWDDTQGTPRRYVRAHGTAGGGRGLIRVRTVNGDIEVRRVR